MSDRNTMEPIGGRALDDLLHGAYGAPPPLPDDFGRRVMERIHARPRRWLRNHAVMAVMAVYWAGAAGASARLLGGIEIAGPAGDSGALPIAFAAVGVCTVGLWLLMRQSRLRASDLFLKSLR